MTFGDEWGWGITKAEAEKVMDLPRGRWNFIDTANFYTGAQRRFVGIHSGPSRALSWRRILQRRARNDPNARNHRKSMMHAVESV